MIDDVPLALVPVALRILDAAELIGVGCKEPRASIGNGSVSRGSLLPEPAEKASRNSAEPTQ
jgi:hypothetical protein